MLASTILLGIAAGLAFGGRWERLTELRFTWWPVLALALGIRIAALFLGEVGLVPYLISFAALLGAAIADRTLPGMAFVIAGASLNFLVVLVNGGMPVDPALAASTGAQIPQDGLHVRLDQGTRLPFLADVLLVPWIQRIYSPGDLLLATGGFVLPFAASRRT